MLFCLFRVFKVWIFYFQEILGTANSIGATVDGKKPKAIQKEMDQGLHQIPE